MNYKDEILPLQYSVSGHVHLNWFEVDRNKHGTIIMCQDGCRRLLAKDGYVAWYNKETDEWIKL